MTIRPTAKSTRRSAFTLLEILVVVAIIAALAGVAVVYLLPQGEKAKRDIAATEIKTIEQSAEMYYNDHGVWPETLEMLLQRSEAGFGPYLKDADSILDPWNTIYGYDPNSIGPQDVERPRIFVQSPKGQGIANYQ